MDLNLVDVPGFVRYAVPRESLRDGVEPWLPTAPCVACDEPLSEERVAAVAAPLLSGAPLAGGLAVDTRGWVLGAAHRRCRQRDQPANVAAETIMGGEAFEARTFTHGTAVCVLLNPAVNTAVFSGGRSFMHTLLARGEWSAVGTPPQRLSTAGDYAILSGPDGGIVTFRLWGGLRFDCYASASIVGNLDTDRLLQVFVALTGPVAALSDQAGLDAVMGHRHTRVAVLQPERQD